MSTTAPAFTIVVECTNCGDVGRVGRVSRSIGTRRSVRSDVFERDYEPRTYVEDKPRDGVHFNNTDCDEWVGSCDCCGRLECPTCELRKYLTIDDRNPCEDRVELRSTSVSSQAKPDSD